MSSFHDPLDQRLRLDVVDGEHAMRVTLRGEADKGSLDQLDTALGGIEPDGARLVVLDVSALGFVDVAALRHLTLFARRLTQSGHRVETHGAGRTLSELARLVGVHDDLNII